MLAGTRTRRKAYLIAFLDDATRVVPYCAFALSETRRRSCRVSKQALHASRHSAAVVRRQRRQLSLATTRAGVRPLGVALIHARPVRPRGRVSRNDFFAPSLTAAGHPERRPTPASLDALNRRLWAWVEAEYHHNPHRGLDRRHAAGPLGRRFRDRRRAHPAPARPRARLRCPVPGRDQAPRPARPHRQPQRHASSRSTPRWSARPSPCATTPAPRWRAASRSGTTDASSYAPARWTPMPTASCAATAPPRPSRPSPHAPAPRPGGLSLRDLRGHKPEDKPDDQERR